MNPLAFCKDCTRPVSARSKSRCEYHLEKVREWNRIARAKLREENKGRVVKWNFNKREGVRIDKPFAATIPDSMEPLLRACPWLKGADQDAGA